MVKKKAKKELTTSQKQAIVYGNLKLVQQRMGLENWSITASFDGDWTSKIAQTTTQANYKSALIEFHKTFAGEYYDKPEKLREVLKHELIHIIHSPLHRQYNDAVTVLLFALKTALNDRYNSLSEQTTTHLERIFCKGGENDK